MKIFAINLGSTSTKIAYYEDETCRLKQTIAHSLEDLQHADGSLRDAPLDRMDLRHAVGGGKIKFFSVFHSITSSFMI